MENGMRKMENTMGKLRDVETTARIKLALMTNPRVGGMEIGVDTVNGIVFLTGFVQDHSKRELAEKIVRAHGGLDVKNDIQILSDETVLEGSFNEPERKGFVEPAEDDLLIRDQVLLALAQDGGIDLQSIRVESDDGIVRISGVQNTDGDARRVEQIANSVPRVRGVVNQILVRRAAWI